MIVEEEDRWKENRPGRVEIREGKEKERTEDRLDKIYKYMYIIIVIRINIHHTSIPNRTRTQTQTEPIHKLKT